MPSRKDLGAAHTNPPLARVTLAARQLDPAWQHKVAPGPNGRQKHVSAMWEVAVEWSGGPRGARSTPHPVPLPHFGEGGCKLPEGQTLVGMFAYRLVSGHGRVQAGVAGQGGRGRGMRQFLWGCRPPKQLTKPYASIPMGV